MESRLVDSCDQIFIVGPARSGTSIMMRAIREVFPEYRSYDEGHFLDLICVVEKAADDFLNVTKTFYRQFENMTISKIDRDKLLRRLTLALLNENAAALASYSIIDKTHGSLMVLSLPAIVSVLPKSRFIFMKRRLNEYLRSANIKFHWWSQEERIDHWVSTMEAWLAVRPLLGCNFIEIEHLDLVNRPWEVGENLAAYLGLPPSKGPVLASFFQTNSIEKSPGLSYQPVDLVEVGLSDGAAAELLDSTCHLRASFQYGAGKHCYTLPDE